MEARQLVGGSDLHLLKSKRRDDAGGGDTDPGTAFPPKCLINGPDLCAVARSERIGEAGTAFGVDGCTGPGAGEGGAGIGVGMERFDVGDDAVRGGPLGHCGWCRPNRGGCGDRRDVPRRASGAHDHPFRP